jgi:hypothetical protein
MDDLLKEAIADAKAVRETALENAKMALEEAFTPRLQNMLSQKIQNEIEDEDDDKKEEDVDLEERDDEDDMEERSMMKAADEDPSDDHSDDDVDESNIIEIDGVKYAPIAEEEDDEEEMDEDLEEREDDDDMDEDLDLESVIKELESELDEVEKDDDDEKNEEIEEGEEIEENDVSSDIGKGDNKVNAKANSSSGGGSEGKAKLKEGEEVDEDIDLDEVLAALSEEEDEDEKKDEVAELKSDLEEHRSVIETLRGKLNEVNLLNAKLLFTNKLFRKYGLNNEQKMKVVEQFDRASNLREVKLVYSTLGESFNGARKNEINESKGAASKPVASTKSEKEVITESNDLRDRFKKLANLI